MALSSKSLGLCLAAALTGCLSKHDPLSDVKIANGTVVTAPNDPAFQSTVALLDSSGQQFCSGTIIDANTVVSAAHCFWTMEDKFKQEGLSIGFGTGPTYTAVLPVTRVFYHKNFALQAVETAAENQWSAAFPQKSAQVEALIVKQQAGTLTPAELVVLTQISNEVTQYILPALATPNQAINDISIMHFDGTAPAGAKDVNLASSPVNAGMFVEIAGYGLTNEDGTGTHGQLRKGTVGVKGLNATALELTTTPVNGMDTCKGDSGGPAYIVTQTGLELLGITSRTPTTQFTCGKTGSVFTDVRYHQQWLYCQASKLAGGEGDDCAPQDPLVVEILPASGGSSGAGCLTSDESLELLLLAAAQYGATQPSGTQLDAASVVRLAALTARYQQAGMCQQTTPPPAPPPSASGCLSLEEAATLAVFEAAQQSNIALTAEQTAQLAVLEARYTQFNVCQQTNQSLLTMTPRVFPGHAKKAGIVPHKAPSTSRIK